ncbi:MAG: 4'-phosphopantetheinyl transferase superfamily protein [Oligoflexia bacterium]|nr:4'-phosphopantetheinyl transferase superfamily protein [Oligoflexia bacterium]
MFPLLSSSAQSLGGVFLFSRWTELLGQPLPEPVPPSHVPDVFWPTAQFWDPPAQGKNSDHWKASRILVSELLEIFDGRTPISLSLSHTTEAIAVVAVPRTAVAMRVGVDLESESRAISEEVLKRVATPKELKLGLTAHQLWTSKEASFKALLQNDEIPITKVLLKSFDQGLSKGAALGPDPSLVISYFIESFDGFTASMAVSRRP